MATSFDERINEVQRLNHNQFDMVNQLLNDNHEIIGKVEEISKMSLRTIKLKDELRAKKEIIERMNKPT